MSSNRGFRVNFQTIMMMITITRTTTHAGTEEDIEMTGKTAADSTLKKEMTKKIRSETREKDGTEGKKLNRKVRNKRKTKTMDILERKRTLNKFKTKNKPSQILITLKLIQIRPKQIQ